MDTTAIRDAALRSRAVLMEALRAAGADPGKIETRQAAATHLLRAAAKRMLRARGLDAGVLDHLLPLNETPPLGKGEQGGVAGRAVPRDARVGWPQNPFWGLSCGGFPSSSSPTAERISSRKTARKGFRAEQSPQPPHMPDMYPGCPSGERSSHVCSALDAILDGPLLAKAWQPGGEEALGWFYQYFNEPDIAVFHGSRPPKVTAELLPAKTQLFTPRWIVRFLVENTLGRLWLQMHPDSRLADQVEYLVPPAEPLPLVVPKPVGEMRVLDPACGAMHFGLVVFDLLAEMYREELQRTGQPGWPDQPSVAGESAIPAAILANNLFGFDIDPLAVRLSATTLYLKAISLSPNMPIVPQHLHCADALRRAGGMLWEDNREIGEATADVLGATYDVVLTNPPYLDSRDYDAPLKSFVADAYPTGKRNLYGAFLERCIAFLGEGGRLGIITPQTFMFISSFAGLRDVLRRSVAIETLVQGGLGTFPDAVVDAAFYVLRREANAGNRDRCLGTYFRLTRLPDTQAKRRAFEQAVATLRRGRVDSRVFLCRQTDFDHIPGRPWVYWITPRARDLFDRLPKLSRIAKPIVGLQTSDNFRFLRFWWEVFFRGDRDDAVAANRQITFGCHNRDEALATGRKWFPHIKGGDFRRWYGNQEYVVNWADDGAEIRSLGIESGKVASRPQNMDYYFRPGVTWTHTSSRGLSVRILPPGFICNVEGMAAFPLDACGSSLETLAIMNSSFARHVIDLLNPTVHFGGREVGDLPYPQADPSVVEVLESHVSRAIELVRQDSREDETTWEFVAPPDWQDGLKGIGRRREQLAVIERLLDDEVYSLYGLGPEDRAAIEADLNGSGLPCQGLLTPPLNEGGQGGGSLCRDIHLDAGDARFLPRKGVGRKDSPDKACEKGFSHERDEACERGSSHERDEGCKKEFSCQPGEGFSHQRRADLAHRWISYAVGVVMGRFRPGVEGALGCGCFDARTVARLRGISIPDGIAELANSEQEDLAELVMRALGLMLGEQDAREVVGTVAGGKQGSIGALRKYLAGGFFRRHLRQYRNRPVYWLLQSPNRRCGVYVHYEQISTTTLEILRGERFLAGHLTAAKQDHDDARLAELLSFDDAIARILDFQSERGEKVGWQLEPDDGVLINAAPLRELLSPAWKEPAECWHGLSAGDYDWSCTAARYWPDRVLTRCREVKSLALAHRKTQIPGRRADQGL